VHLPLNLRHNLRSGSSTALGLADNTKSGIDFIVCAVGQHGGLATVCKAASDDETSSTDNEDSNDGAHGAHGAHGASAAYANAMFQHSSHMTKLAKFRPAATLLTLANQHGTRQPFRKGQLDPSVFYRAIMAAVETSNKPIAATDAFVNFTGGTTECLVGAIAAGFRKIFHVCSSPDEVLMMQLPGEEVERNLNYMEYVSPEPVPRPKEP
jgi:hypothetical protein